MAYCDDTQVSLGEMVAYLPLPGGHITLAERFVDPAFSFALGWNYCGYTFSVKFLMNLILVRVQLDYSLPS